MGSPPLLRGGRLNVSAQPRGGAGLGSSGRMVVCDGSRRYPARVANQRFLEARMGQHKRRRIFDGQSPHPAISA